MQGYSAARAPTGWKKSPPNNTKPDQDRKRNQFTILRRLAAFPKRRRCSTIPWQTTIYPQVEAIPVRQLDEAYQKVPKDEVKFR